MASIKTFRGGRNGGTYKCGVCLRLTRKTTEGQTHLCGQCDQWTMQENLLNDSGESMTSIERGEVEQLICNLKMEAAKKGGDRARLGLL